MGLWTFFFILIHSLMIVNVEMKSRSVDNLRKHSGREQFWTQTGVYLSWSDGISTQMDILLLPLYMLYNFRSTFCDWAKNFQLTIQCKGKQDFSGRWALIDEYISHHMTQNNNPIGAIDYKKSLKYLDVSMTQSLINNGFHLSGECLINQSLFHTPNMPLSWYSGLMHSPLFIV